MYLSTILILDILVEARVRKIRTAWGVCQEVNAARGKAERYT